MQSRKTLQITLLLLSVKLLFSQNFDSQRSDHVSKCDEWQLPKKRIVCFYRVEDVFRPYDLDPCLCSHVIYSYVAIRENFAFIAGKKGDLKFLAALKRHNPNLKILVSLRPGSNQFSLDETAKTNTTAVTVRTKFARRVRDFITRHGLDGVDLDWEYFKEAQKQISKRETLTSVLRILHNELQPLNKPLDVISYLLTITTSKFPKDLADFYDFSEIYRFVDFVNLPAFNFDTQGKTVIHPSRVHGISDMENMDSMIDLVLALGLPQDQLVVGVPAYGTLYHLSNTSLTVPGSPSIPWNYEEAIISHSKICAVRDNSNWTLIREKDLTAPYIYYRDKWIGFDDEISIKLKAKYIALRQVGGIAFWSVNDDDPTGKCGYGPYPLLQSIRSVFTKPVDNINYNKANNTINSITQPISQYGNVADTSFVAVIEKYGNVERIINDGSEANQLTCSQTGYIRHPQECSKFYRCIKFNQNDENAEKFQYQCPLGLVFDERYEICNWPSWSPTCPGSGEIVPVTKKRFVCPSYGYFQDPENCEYFYYCSDFGKGYLQAYEFKCPFELAFDEEKLLCNWKWLVKGCGTINPEDQVIRELPQIFNQNTETEQLDPSNDKLLERSDFLDTDQSESLLFTDFGTQHKETNRKETSKIRKVTEYMTKWVGDLGNRLKSLWFSKLESRADKPDIGWLSQFIPKFQKKQQTMDSPNNGNNRRASTMHSTKQRIPYHSSDQMISIPIIEIRPESQRLGPNPSKKRTQTQQRVQLPASKPIRNQIPLNRNHFSANGVQEKDLSQAPSITRTVPVPLLTVHHKNRHQSLFAQPFGLPLDYQSIANQFFKSSTATPQKTSRRPLITTSSNSNARKSLNKLNVFHEEKTRPKPIFHFPTSHPLIIETLEEIPIPHYLPQQISLQSIPGPKKSNIRDQQQRYLGGIDSHKEVLYFSPEELNLDKLKIETKTTRKPAENLKPLNNHEKDKNNNNLPQKPYTHSSDSNPLNLLHFSLSGSDAQHESQISHENIPQDMRIKGINMNSQQDNIKAQSYQKQASDVRQTQVRYYESKDKQQIKNSPQIKSHVSVSYSVGNTQLPQHQQIQTQLSHSEEKPFPQQTNQINLKQNPQLRQRIPQQSQSQRQNSQRNPQQKHTQKQSITQKPNPQYSEQRPQQQYPQPLPKANIQQFTAQHVPQMKPQLLQQQRPQQNQQAQQEWSQFQESHITSKPQSIIYWPNIQDFESVKTTIKPFSMDAQNEERTERTRAPHQSISNSGLHSSVHNQNDLNYLKNINTFYETEASNKQKTIESSQTSQKKVAEHLDASATSNEQFASYYEPIQRLNYESNANKKISAQSPQIKNRIIFPESSTPLKHSDESRKSQLLIIPVSDEYSDAQKYSNFDRLTKDYPKLFPDGLSNTRISTVSYQINPEVLTQKTTTSRPRILFSSSPTVLPSELNDEYIMLMLNNGQHLMSKHNESSASLHDIFKKTDGKLYNLETADSKTLVALVPKSKYQTTQKPIQPIVYETVRDHRVSFNVTQPPVIIKLEIPRPKSDLFQSIVQKVKDEWMTSPDMSYDTFYDQILRDHYKGYSAQKPEMPTTTRPFVTVTQSSIPITTTRETTQTPEIVSKATVPASIYDSIQYMMSKNPWSQQSTGHSESLETTTLTPISIGSTQPKVTTQDSVVLEHIPVYNGYNAYNYSHPSWQYGMHHWYHQMPTYPAAQPYYGSAFPPLQNHTSYGPHYPYYPMAPSYPYQPPQVNQPSHNFQPQFLSTNLTSNHWYDSYTSQITPTERTEESYPQYNKKSESITSSVSSETTEDNIYTTTTSPSTTQSTTTAKRYTPKIRNNNERLRPSLTRRTTTKKPKTSTLAPIDENIDQNVATVKSIDLQRTKNGEQPQIQVYIVQGENGPQLIESKPISHHSDVSDQSDVKVVYIDGSKKDQIKDEQQNRYSNTNQNEENADKPVLHYENDKFQTSQEHPQQPNNPYDRYEYQLGPETLNIESTHDVKDRGTNEALYPHEAEHHINKDIEYEDEPQININQNNMQEIRPQYHQYYPASKAQSLQSIYNQNAYPGLRNFTDGSVPESACTRPGLFQHPFDCNKYYECYWDKYINKFTLHSFECPVKLAFDSRIVGCSAPSDPTICVQY